MENSNNLQDKNLEYNKEERYRAEIFDLLKRTFTDSDSEESFVIRDLFMKDKMDDDQLLNLIKALK